MKLQRCAMSVFLLLLANWAMAQGIDLTGMWKAEVNSPQGKSEQTITFKQTGNTFTGEMITSQGAKEAIKDGKVTGDEIEFTVERKRPTGETALVPYKGQVTGDEITGTFVGASGRTLEWTAKRQ